MAPSADLRRRRGLGSRGASRHRLSFAADPDLVNDLAIHEIDEWVRPAPVRRHSMASIPRLDKSLVNQRASSETHLKPKWEPEKSLEPVPTTNSWKSVFLFLGVVIGNVVASFTLQKLNNLSAGCGQLVTFLQYMATITEKSSSAREYLGTQIIPMKWHLSFVVLMFMQAKMSNASLEYLTTSFGLFLVIKNTNLLFSLILGLRARKKYNVLQVLSVVGVTAGVFVCVLADSDESSATSSGESSMMDSDNTGVLIGALLVASATFCTAALGSVQEEAFARYNDKENRAVGESLFFTHLLGLPLFAVGGGLTAMGQHITVLSNNPTPSASLLLANMSATVVLKQCFIQLLEESGALTATMAVTVARMVGVVLSEVSIGEGDGNPPNAQFWFGAFVVAAGSCMYTVGSAKSKQ